MTKEEKTDVFHNMLLQFCSEVVMNQLSLTIKFYPRQEEESYDEAMCSEAAVIPLYESHQHLARKSRISQKEAQRREEESYKRGMAEAYLSIIETAVRLAPERESEEIKEIRTSLLQVMPPEYHERINRISSSKKIITNNYKMEYNKYNNCNIGQVVEKGGNGTVHVHMDGKKEPNCSTAEYAEEVDGEEADGDALSFPLTADQQAAFDRAVEGNLLRSLGNGKYRLIGQKVSLAYFIGRLFCRDYVESKNGARAWRVVDDFPTKAMTAMFGIDDLATTRSTRKNGTPPKDYRDIDGFIEG